MKFPICTCILAVLGVGRIKMSPKEILSCYRQAGWWIAKERSIDNKRLEVLPSRDINSIFRSCYLYNYLPYDINVAMAIILI